jgi:hypothetical protein
MSEPEAPHTVGGKRKCPLPSDLYYVSKIRWAQALLES